MRAHGSAASGRIAEYRKVNAKSQTDAKNVSAKKAALTRDRRRRSTRRPKTSMRSVVNAVGIAYGENAYTPPCIVDISSDLARENPIVAARGAIVERAGG